MSAMSFSASNRAYHTSRARIVLNRAIDSRYDRTQVSTASRASLSLKPLSTACETKLAVRRFTSHSHGAGNRFIKVVNVEDDPPLRRGKAAEIAQMRIAARLHAKARRGCAGKVHRHVERRPAIEGERRRTACGRDAGEQAREFARRWLPRSA